MLTSIETRSDQMSRPLQTPLDNEEQRAADRPQSTRSDEASSTKAESVPTGEIGPRESMAVLPLLMQPFLTWMTGKPLSEEQPVLKWNAVAYFGAPLIQFAIGIAAAWGAAGVNPIAAFGLLAFGWTLTVGAGRTMVDCLLHEAAHLGRDKGQAHAKFHSFGQSSYTSDACRGGAAKPCFPSRVAFVDQVRLIQLLSCSLLFPTSCVN